VHAPVEDLRSLHQRLRQRVADPLPQVPAHGARASAVRAAVTILSVSNVARSRSCIAAPSPSVAHRSSHAHPASSVPLPAESRAATAGPGPDSDRRNIRRQRRRLGGLSGRLWAG
jgi:hypothetical protein